MQDLDVQGYKYVEKWLNECKIGLGTYQVHGPTEILNILDAALSAGYRYIDTAQVYRNEKHIGDALKVLLPKYNLKREDIFIASKLAPANQGFENCKKSVEISLQSLHVDYIDLFLVHWPGCSKVKPADVKNKSIRQESWACLEEFYKAGKLRSIGVSNYNISHLAELFGSSSVSSALNQCEYHPHYYQSDLVDYCKKNMIHFQAYSSFGSESNKADVMYDKGIQAMAKKYNASVTNFLLAWSLSQGISVLPRSRNPEHVKENFEARYLKIAPEDIEAVKKKELRKYCWDPDTIS